LNKFLPKRNPAISGIFLLLIGVIRQALHNKSRCEATAFDLNLSQFIVID